MDLGLARSVAALPAFLAFLALGAAMVAVFLAVYLRATPWPELALIREGNAAAAISLAGALLGFVVPLASVIAHTHLLADVAVWGVVALAVQLATWAAVTALQPGIGERIRRGETASGVLLGTASLAAGIVDAACMAS